MAMTDGENDVPMSDYPIVGAKKSDEKPKVDLEEWKRHCLEDEDDEYIGRRDW